MEQVELSEKELLIDPAFFTSLQVKFPDLVAHVEILPKRMRAINELSCFRYAAVVHVKSKDELPPRIIDIGGDAWIDFVERGLDRPALCTTPAPVFSFITCRREQYSTHKTMLQRCILESLREDTDESMAGGDWLTSVRQVANDRSSLSFSS